MLSWRSITGFNIVNVILCTKCFDDKATARCMNLIRFVLYRVEISWSVYIQTNSIFKLVLHTAEYYWNFIVQNYTLYAHRSNLNWMAQYIIVQFVFMRRMSIVLRYMIYSTVTTLLNFEKRSRNDITNSRLYKMIIEKKRFFPLLSSPLLLPLCLSPPSPALFRLSFSASSIFP